jgi:putative ABC transport system permease protein
VASGALAVFVGVAVLAPVLVRPVVRLIGWPLPRLSAVTGTLARRNAMRNPRRTASTAAALMIGVGLVGFIAVFAASATASVNDAIDRSFTGDLIVDSGQFVGGVSPDLAAAVATVDGVAASTGVRFLTGEIDTSVLSGDGASSGSGDDGAGAGPASGATFLLAVDTTALADITDPEVVTGRVDGLAVDEVAVAAAVATDLGVGVGDQLPARFPTGVRTLTVTGTYDNRLLLGDWMVGLDTADVAAIERLDTQVWVRVAPGADVAAVQSAIAEVAAPWPGADVLDLSQFKQRQADQFNQLLVGIANTLALSVFERTRELGLLRAVGMARGQVRSMVVGEAVLIAVFGTLLGLAIGIGFGWLLVRALAEQGLGVLAVPVVTLGIVVVLAAIAGVAAALLPAARAGRLDVLAAISSE